MSLYVNNRLVEFQTFPNLETRLDLDQSILKPHNKVMWKFVDNSSIFELLLFDNVMSQNQMIYELFIPYLPYSRMDRVEDKLTAFSLKVISDMLSRLNVSKIKILDPHSDKIFELMNSGLIEKFNFSIHHHILKDKDLSNAWIVFPDKGAMKRYNSDLYKNVIVCEKVRDFKTGQILKIDVHVEKGSATGKLYVIDDLCSRGGTFVGGLKAIMSKSIPFESAELIVTHVEESIIDGDVFSTFDKVYSTDSITDLRDCYIGYSKDMIDVTSCLDLYFKGEN